MRTRPAGLLALALLAAACRDGDGRPREAIAGSSTSTTASAPAGTAAPEASTTTAAPTSSSAPAPAATPGTTRNRALPGVTVTTAGPAPTAPPATGPTSSSTVSGPAAAVPFGAVKVKLTQVARLSQPVALAQRTGDEALYIAEKTGRVKAVRNGAVDGAVVLDLSTQVSAGGEQGLLGLAFSPDGNLLYAGFTNTAGDSRLWEYAFRDGRADPATRREILAVDQPFANHNGGQVTIGPDGLLYAFFGDGGAANDPAGNAQNLGELLGKILRIDPKPSGPLPYTIPADNPFVGRPGARGEIYAYGLRNPWRNSFDRQTGDLWIGDVGQNALEEIDFTATGAARGANFGWAYREGTRAGPRPVPVAENALSPIYEYPTSDGCAVTGGYVYRGGAIPGLGGTYVFGDFCNGGVQALRLDGGRLAEHRNLGVTVENLSSFGEDAAGELYALSLSGGLFRLDPA